MLEMPSTIRSMLFLFIYFTSICSQAPSNADRKKNVLLISIDDLRPEIGSFINPDNPTQMYPGMKTPNIDMLASRSLVLRQAFVQQAVCSPSRASVLTSRRPDTTHVYDISTYFRDVGGNYTTIPQYFKNRGYRSAGMGKVFHAGPTAKEDLPSWTEPYFRPPYSAYWKLDKERSWMAVPIQDHVDKPLPDESVAKHATELIEEFAPDAKSGDTPFFLAIGFKKPHLPFVFPEEYLDLYPLDAIGLPSNPHAPRAMPGIGWSSWTELRAYDDIGALGLTGAINSTNVPNPITKDLRRAYYASVSYIDALIGQIMQKLVDVGLEDDTIIAVWGDHGFFLGEHGMWAKHVNFELATWAPMLISVPGLTSAGFVSDELVEFVDLFPTLVEAAGFPELELCPEDSTLVATCTEGSSLIPLMSDSREQGQWKDRVFSQYPRTRDGMFARVMGYTMRTQRYRYTEWVSFSTQTYQPDWSEVYAQELYDHNKDPEENVNRARYNRYAAVKEELSRKLHQNWRAARP